MGRGAAVDKRIFRVMFGKNRTECKYTNNIKISIQFVKIMYINKIMVKASAIQNGETFEAKQIQLKSHPFFL